MLSFFTGVHGFILNYANILRGFVLMVIQRLIENDNLQQM
jgi:hypothetical protein